MWVSESGHSTVSIELCRSVKAWRIYAKRIKIEIMEHCKSLWDETSACFIYY